MTDAAVPAIDLNNLRAPFDPIDLRWRVLRSGKKNGNPWIVVAPYFKLAAMHKRLNAVCGPANWQTRLTAQDGHMVCELGIRIGGEWVWKADATGYIEPYDQLPKEHAGRGDSSNAQKRAGTAWGIGAYLADLPTSFGVVSPDGQFYDKPTNSHWDPPSQGRNRSGQRAEGGGATNTPPKQPMPDIDPNQSAAEKAKEVARCQEEVKTFLETNNLRVYHLDAVLQTTETLPDTTGEFHVDDWQALAAMAKRNPMLWSTSPKKLAEEYPTSEERVTLMRELAGECEIAAGERILMETAIRDGWSDGVEYWIEKFRKRVG